MRKLKSFLIYGTIIILCIICAAGYIISQKPSRDGGRTVNADTTKALDSTPTVTQEQTSSSALPEEVLERIKKSALIPSPNPIVGVGTGSDYNTVTLQAVDNAGGLENLIHKDDVVVIKPNLINGFPPGSPMCTDYRTVQCIADLVKKYGAKKVIVAEASMSGNVFNAASYDKITGVELLDMNKFDKNDCYEIKPDKSLTGKALFIPKVYMDADVVIGLAKLKTHFQPDAVVTLSMKNSIGVPPNKIYNTVGWKNGLHDLGLKEVIVDLNKIRKPDFVVIDGIVGGEGYGPLSNTPVDSNIVFAGIDPVATDTAALTFMGFTVDEVPHVKLAGEAGIGISDINMIKVVGADLNKIKMKFERAQ